jgi:protein TorT
MTAKNSVRAFKLVAGLATVAAVVALPYASGRADDATNWTAKIYAATGFDTVTYEPLPAGSKSKDWHICVAVPHMKDPYYVAKDYGAVAEMKRQGLTGTILAANGYADLTGQIQQIEDCVTQGGNAVIVNAVSDTGLVGLIKELKAKKIAVISMGNPIRSDELDAGIAAEYVLAGGAAGRYLAKTHPKGSGKVKMVWLAGPAGSSWTEDAVKGMQKEIEGSDVEVLKVIYGDTGKEVQMRLIEDALQTYSDVNIIAGVAPAIEGAIEILRNKGIKGVELVSFYSTPETEQGVRDGTVKMTVSDDNVIAARINVDQALRVLEGKPVTKIARSVFTAVDATNVNSYGRDTLLAPKDFKPTFEVK